VEYEHVPKKLRLQAPVPELSAVQAGLIQRATEMRNRIHDADLAWLSNPEHWDYVPHPCISLARSPRFTFDDDGQFSFMGRTALTDLTSQLDSAQNCAVCNVLGTKEFGKSHLLAAYVAKRMQACFLKKEKARPVIFLAKCGDLIESRATYLQEAMALAFAGDAGVLDTIARLSTDFVTLLDWLNNREFDVVADQCNDLFEPLHSHDADGREAIQRIVKELGTRAGFTINGFSANNEIIKLFKNKERSHLDVELYGGLNDEVCSTLALL
jgi:hypothetical protein